MWRIPAGCKRLPEPGFRWLYRLTFILSAGPALNLAIQFLQDRLGADPVETLTRNTGIWTLNFLLISLAITPLRQMTGCLWLVRLRRLLGLSCFFYACLHLLTYLVFDQFFDWAGILKDVVKRPYITAGFFTFLVLFPLAITSSDAMVRRLGRRWKSLHRWVYLAGFGGVLHFLWLVKRDVTDPAWYGLVLFILLGLRMARPRNPPATGA